MSHKDHISELIEIRERRLQFLNKNKAHHGPETAIHILMEIEEQEDEIENLRSQLEALEDPNEKSIKIENWKGYLQNLEAKTEFNKAGYQILFSSEGKPLSDAIEDFVRSPQSLLVIRGNAGCGKSLFLRDQVHQRSANLLVELDYYTPEWSKEFRNPIPILMSLNSQLINPGESLGRKILNRLKGSNLLQIPAFDEPEKIFEESGKSWLIFLDAFDEIYPQSQDNMWSSIIDLAELHSNVKVLMTVRPGQFLRKKPEFATIVDVKPLTKEQILSYISAQIERDDFEPIEEFLNNSASELWEHLCYPLFLWQAANYLAGGGQPVQQIEPLDLSDASESSPSPSEISSHQVQNEVTASGDLEISQISALVNKELEEQLEVTEEVEMDIFQQSFPEEEPDPAPFRVGELMDRVYKELWRHNEKKATIGIMPVEEIHDNLGRMAANMGGSEIIRRETARSYVGTAIYWIMDLGVLIVREGSWVAFLTTLSRAYFAASYVSTLLIDIPNDIPEEFFQIINDKEAIDFWNECLNLVQDLLPAGETTALELCIEVLKGD